MKGHKDVLSLFLSKGSNVDAKNDFVSPLRYAATFGYHDTVKILLDHGANPNFVFHDIFTPLHASIYSHSWKCVELLLKAGADPNGGPDGFKTLPFAAGKVQIIKLLAEAGADPNVTDIQELEVEVRESHHSCQPVLPPPSEPPCPEPINNSASVSASQPDLQLDNGSHAEFPTHPATTKVNSTPPSYNDALQDAMLQQPVVVNRRVCGSVARLSDFRSLGVVPDRKIHPSQIVPSSPSQTSQTHISLGPRREGGKNLNASRRRGSGSKAKGIRINDAPPQVEQPTQEEYDSDTPTKEEGGDRQVAEEQSDEEESGGKEVNEEEIGGKKVNE
ncbi:ankyrin repeat domain-containing protein 50-like [Papaver somniferum]|uniref:ankyrin repeat domain-containing protein 50-like n=1 Tax=Papaver somniferum TaxID=3469 RepID=UPI000E70335D|nr:ankyrin repeat domain-containing protein 50-like [Papaver somniferum]